MVSEIERIFYFLILFLFIVDMDKDEYRVTKVADASTFERKNATLQLLLKTSKILIGSICKTYEIQKG